MHQGHHYTPCSFLGLYSNSRVCVVLLLCQRCLLCQQGLLLQSSHGLLWGTPHFCPTGDSASTLLSAVSWHSHWSYRLWQIGISWSWAELICILFQNLSAYVIIQYSSAWVRWEVSPSITLPSLKAQFSIAVVTQSNLRSKAGLNLAFLINTTQHIACSLPQIFVRRILKPWPLFSAPFTVSTESMFFRSCRLQFFRSWFTFQRGLLQLGCDIKDQLRTTCSEYSKCFWILARYFRSTHGILVASVGNCYLSKVKSSVNVA